MAVKCTGGRTNACNHVVFDVLERIDCIIANGPENRAGIEQNWRCRERAEGRRPPDQSAPCEGRAQNRLRPGADPLHEWIEADDPKRGKSQKDRKPVKT